MQQTELALRLEKLLPRRIPIQIRRAIVRWPVKWQQHILLADDFGRNAGLAGVVRDGGLTSLRSNQGQFAGIKPVTGAIRALAAAFTSCSHFRKRRRRS